MKKLKFTILLFNLLNSGTGFTNFSKDMFNLGGSYDLPNLEFYDNPQLKNKPVMILNEKGIFYKDKLICERKTVVFSKDKFYHINEHIYHRGEKGYHSSYNELPFCKDSPIISTTTFKGSPEFTLHFFEIDALSKSIATVKYKNEKLYINLDSFKKEPWMGISDSWEKVMAPEAKAMLDDPKYQTFVKEVKDCLKKKSEICLSKYTEPLDTQLQRFGGQHKRGNPDGRKELNLKLNSSCDGDLESALSFAKCIISNEILVKELTKCLDSKTTADFYDNSPKGRILKCYIVNQPGEGYQLYNFFSAKKSLYVPYEE